jgi:hypothetical protein
LQDVRGDLACVGGIDGPVDVPTSSLQLIGEMSEETVEVSEGVKTDGTGSVAETFQGGQFLN